MLRLKLLQLVHERVVLRISQFWRVLDVIQMFVVAKLIAQLLNLVVWGKRTRHRFGL